MKTALMAIVLLSSLNVFASTTETYEISEPSVVPTQYGVQPGDVALCPRYNSLEVVQGADLKGEGLLFDYQGDIVATKPAGSSRTCFSDVVCPADDNFDFVNGNGYASITRNNDSNYPTTDLPGYSELSIHISAAAKKGSVDCYYGLKKK